jgi:hypothetical protein
VPNAPGGAGQAVHEVPQVRGSSSATHTPLHAWKPAAQVVSHVPRGQIGSAFSPPGQGTHALPQVSGESSRPQAVPQS